MTNFIKFYHFIISSLIIFILIGFVLNIASAQAFIGDWLMPSGNREAERQEQRQEQRRLRTPIANETTLATEVRDVNRDIERHRRDINSINVDIRNLEQELIPIVQAVRRECPGVVAVGTVIEPRVCVYNPGGGDQLTVGMPEESVNRYNEARRKQIEIDRMLRLKRGALSILTGRLEALDDRITDDVPVDARREPERQALTIDALKLQARFSELDDNLEDIDQVLDSVETIYDRTVLGAYMQDKIGQLLNSQVICTARKRCAIRDPEKIPPGVIQRELFPTSERIRESYYNHDRLQRIRRERGVQ